MTLRLWLNSAKSFRIMIKEWQNGIQVCKQLGLKNLVTQHLSNDLSQPSGKKSFTMAFKNCTVYRKICK